jgi:hypothetical protein
LKPIAALLAPIAATTIQRKTRGGGGPPAARKAERRAKGRAKIEWLKRIAERVDRSRAKTIPTSGMIALRSDPSC